MHPFARARERTRALNAAKMERMFAKPFVASLEGHVDAVETMARKPDTLDVVASGSWDGGAFLLTVTWSETRVGYSRSEHGYYASTLSTPPPPAQLLLRWSSSSPRLHG